MALIFQTQKTKKFKPFQLIAFGIQVKKLLLKDDNQYNQYNWDQIFKHLSQSSNISFFLKSIQNSCILKDIQQIKFNQLKYLKLQNCSVESLQPLSIIECPCLVCLILIKNHINQIKPLIKLASKSLQRIFLGNNPINQIDSLTKTKFNTIKKMQAQPNQWFIRPDYIMLQFKDSIPIHQDLRILVKLNSDLIQQIIVSQYRMNKQQIRKILKKRFLQCSTYQQDTQDIQFRLMYA